MRPWETKSITTRATAIVRGAVLGLGIALLSSLATGCLLYTSDAADE